MRRALVEAIESEEVEWRGEGRRWRVVVVEAGGASVVEAIGMEVGGVVKGMFVFGEVEDGRKRNCWGLMSYLDAIGRMSYFCDMFAVEELLELAAAMRCTTRPSKQDRVEAGQMKVFGMLVPIYSVCCR